MATAEAETSRDAQVPPGGLVYDGFISYSHAADDLLAPRLQAGLQRFAKPWWKRRALRVFRDESSLSANPHLWSSITDALDQSDWFVLLLSPDAAESPWVNNEVEYWLEHKDPDRIIPVLTDGEFGWAEGDIVSDAAPPALLGAFADEPRWVDLRFARTEEQLDLNNPAFAAAIADIASPIRGVPKDELLSEEVRQHRRTVRTAWAAGAVVLLLGVAALVAATVAVGQSNEAQTQRDEAERLAAAEADARAEAETNEQRAEEQTAIAQDNERTARAEALAAHSVAQLDIDPELSVLLAAQALSLEPRPAALDAMHSALQSHRTIFQVEMPDPTAAAGSSVGGMSPDGTLLAVSGSHTDLMDVWDIDSGELLWSLSTADEPWKIIQASFSDDGEDLIVYLVYPFDGDNTAPAELRVFGADDGSLRRIIDAPDCSGMKYFPGPTTPFWDLSGQVIWTVDDDCDYFGTGHGEVGLLDLATGAFTPVLPIEALVSTGPGQPTIDSSASRLAVSDLSGGGRVVDIASGEVLFEYPGGLATLSADGTRLLTGSVPGVSPVELWDIDESRLLWRFDAEFGGAGFSPDGTLAGGAQAGTIYILDAETGFERLRLRGHTSFAAPRVVSIDNSRLVSFGGDGMARVWDIGSQLVSEGTTYAVHPRPSNHDGGSGVVANGIAAIWTGGPMLGGNADWETAVIDLETGEILASVSGGSPALSSDGSLLAYRIADRVTLSEKELRGYAPAGEYRRIGDVRIIDVRTGDVVAEVAAPCHSYQTSTRTVPQEGCGTAEDDLEWAKRWKLALSPDHSLLALTDGVDNSVTLLDVETGEVLLVDRSPDNNFAGNPVFSPDGAQLAADFGHLGGCEIRIYELDSYTMEAEIEMGSACTGAVDFTGDGRYLVGGDWLGNITYIDTDDWSLSPPVLAHQSPEFADLTSNPSGTLIVTASEDAVRVWNVADQSLHTEITATAGPVRIAAFIDDTHLLVVPQHSAVAMVITLDPADLVELAQSRVTRAFRADECATYDIDPCPTTLEALRGG